MSSAPSGARTTSPLDTFVMKWTVPEAQSKFWQRSEGSRVSQPQKQWFRHTATQSVWQLSWSPFSDRAQQPSQSAVFLKLIDLPEGVGAVVAQHSVRCLETDTTCRQHITHHWRVGTEYAFDPFAEVSKMRLHRQLTFVADVTIWHICDEQYCAIKTIAQQSADEMQKELAALRRELASSKAANKRLRGMDADARADEEYEEDAKLDFVTPKEALPMPNVATLEDFARPLPKPADNEETVACLAKHEELLTTWQEGLVDMEGLLQILSPAGNVSDDEVETCEEEDEEASPPEDDFCFVKDDMSGPASEEEEEEEDAGPASEVFHQVAAMRRLSGATVWAQQTRARQLTQVQNQQRQVGLSAKRLLQPCAQQLTQSVKSGKQVLHGLRRHGVFRELRAAHQKRSALSAQLRTLHDEYCAAVALENELTQRQAEVDHDIRAEEARVVHFERDQRNVQRLLKMVRDCGQRTDQATHEVPKAMKAQWLRFEAAWPTWDADDVLVWIRRHMGWFASCLDLSAVRKALHAEHVTGACLRSLDEEQIARWSLDTVDPAAGGLMLQHARALVGGR